MRWVVSLDGKNHVCEGTKETLCGLSVNRMDALYEQMDGPLKGLCGGCAARLDLELDLFGRTVERPLHRFDMR